MKSRANEAMVSCLLVTLPVAERLPHLKSSIAAYCAQTHRVRELVVVLDRGSDEATTATVDHVASLGRDDIRVVKPPRKLTLGGLRNVSRESARGDILCQWDDDDMHHPTRVERQLQALLESGGEAVHLGEAMHLFLRSRQLYCTNWRATEATGLPGTLMCRRSARICYPETGPSSERGEDSEVAVQLLARAGLRALAGAPHLYVYVNHGSNSSGDDHHRMLVRRLGISRGMLLRREAQLREGLRAFDFGPGDVTVQGYNGTAFVIASGGGDLPRRTEMRSR